MARLDRLRLTRGVFPFHCEVPTRFTDLDVQGHVNNVAMAGLVQEGRARFAQTQNLGAFLKGHSLAVASLTIEFASEARHPDPVQIDVGILEIGRTSYRLGVTVRQNGQVAAFAEIVMVAFKDGAAVPIADGFRARLEELKISEPQAAA